MAAEASRVQLSEGNEARISGRYLVRGELGRGGAGAAYRAFDEATERVVALKTLERDTPKLVAMFEREYHTLASLKHPRVIEVYDFGIAEDGRRYYTMELLPGQDMLELSPLPWKVAASHMRDVATSLALLHARRLLHRDVSPRNVRLDGHGRAKLIDFGALCSFGTPPELVGTPQCMAPEAVRGLALDQRADLFSFGTVLYWAITGHAPFALRQLRDAEAAYRELPAPPSAYAADIPKAFDQLVLSLLSVDPSERPTSAAEVIERLSALADLPDEPLELATESYLRNSTLVGRERERMQLHQHLVRTQRGQGAVVLVEGERSVGRTRLTNELLIDARIAGLIALRVEALSHREPFGTMRALAQALLREAPSEAAATLPAHVGVLSEAFEELAPHDRKLAPRVAPPADASERRSLIQSAMAKWLSDVAQRRPLLVLIDDLHGVDASSAGSLALLAHAAPSARLMLVCTQLAGESLAPAAQQIGRLAARIKLRRLGQAQVEQLVGSVFGDVPNQSRLAQWLNSVARGNPGHTLLVLRQLVERGVIRHEAGAWLLPTQLAEQDLPKDFEDALRARFRQVDEHGQQLTRMFALHRGSLALPECLKLLPNLSPGELTARLELLVGHEFLLSSGEHYRLAQDALRTIALDGLDVSERRRLYRALARALTDVREKSITAIEKNAVAAVSVDELGAALRAGWYLVEGGEEARGRAMLRIAALELASRGEGLSEAIPALEDALASYRREGLSRYEMAPLLIPLVAAGLHVDPALIYRYGEDLVDTLCDATGLNMARRLERVLGVKLALFVSLFVAIVLFPLTKRKHVARSFKRAVMAAVSLGVASVGVCSALDDPERMQRLQERLRPLRGFPPGHPARLAHEHATALAEGVHVEYPACERRLMHLLEQVRSPKVQRSIDANVRAQFEIGILFTLGMLEGMRSDVRFHSTIAALERLDTRFARETAAGLRMLYHGFRGERALFLRHLEHVDVLAAQSGSTWMMDFQAPRYLWLSQALSEDVMGLKRAAGQFAQWSASYAWLAEYRDAATGCYLVERGGHADALRASAEAIERAVSGPPLRALRFAAAHAWLLRRSGRAEQAKAYCEETLRKLGDQVASFPVFTFGLQIELARSLTDLGALRDAAKLLDTMIEQHESHDNPLVHGLTHRVRAQVALLEGDRTGFERHLRSTEDWFRRAENPALLAQCQRLAEEGRAAGFLTDPRRGVLESLMNKERTLTQIRTVFNACRGPAERLQAAVDLMIQHSGAAHGYLYLLEPEGLRFAAPVVGLEPPEALRLDLEQQIKQRQEAEEQKTRLDADMGHTTVILQEDETDVRTQQGLTYRTELLLVTQGAAVVVVGAVALCEGDTLFARISPVVVEEIARGIYAAGDIHTVYLATPKTATPANSQGVLS